VVDKGYLTYEFGKRSLKLVQTQMLDHPTFYMASEFSFSFCS
jgi:hypothetical protein